MSKTIKGMLTEDYRQRLGDIEDVTVISLRGVNANDNNSIRRRLGGKDIKVTVVRNALFSRAFEGTNLAVLDPILTGANAVAYGAESVVEVARELVDIIKEFPDVELRGAVLDGELYAGADGVERLSKFPTRDEAIAQNITLILSPARNLVGAVKGPGAGLAGVIKAIEEKLEKGEEIAKV